MTLSVIIPTRNRLQRLRRTLRSLAAQSRPPEEVIVIDGGDSLSETVLLQSEFAPVFGRFTAVRANSLGAAAQRNQGIALTDADTIGFCDDDIDLYPECLRILRDYLVEQPEFGGVSAAIINQAPRGFGFPTRAVAALIDSRRGEPLDGRVIGPAINFMPVFHPDAAAVCVTEWLSTTCVIYRRAVLPSPVFNSHFHGYSMLEDVCLSLAVGQRTKLAVLRDAQIFHDSQPGDHKRSVGAVARMCLENRFFVATRVLGRPRLTTWSQLALWQVFMAVAGLRRIGSGWFQQNSGAFSALAAIATGRK